MKITYLNLSREEIKSIIEKEFNVKLLDMRLSSKGLRAEIEKLGL